MRPKAIVTFERLFLLSIALSAVMLAIEPNYAVGPLSAGAMQIVKVVGILLSAGLLLWASRGRSRVAQWVLAALTLLGVLGTLSELTALEPLGRSFWLGLLGTVLQAAAVVASFTEPARAWFAGRDASV